MDFKVAVRTAVRSAILAKLAGTSYAATPVTYQPTRAPIALPAITFRDVGVKSDDVVPLYDRILHVDVWTRLGLDDAEAIAALVNSALDHQGITLPGDEAQIAFLMLQSDQDQPQEDADLTRKMLTYRALVYEYNGPQPP